MTSTDSLTADRPAVPSQAILDFQRSDYGNCGVEGASDEVSSNDHVFDSYTGDAGSYLA